MPNFAAFMSYVLVTSFTPGPNNIMCMSNASRYGIRKSIWFNVGVFVGFFLVLSLCSLLGATLYELVPSIKPAMTAVGAVYILYLAWKTYDSKPHDEQAGERQTTTFWSGVLLQFVNPKGILFGITTASTFLVPYYKSVVVLTAFSALLAFIGFTATCCWSFFGSVFQRYLITNRKLINTIMASLLMYCAVSLFF